MDEGWWGSSENLIRSFVFVPGVTQESKDAGSYNSFPCFHSFRNPPPLQKLWKESSKSTPTRILRTWTLVTSTQDTSPMPAPPPPHTLKTTGYIHHLAPPPEIHSLTTFSSKQKQPPKEESHSKTINFHFTITTITLMTTTSRVSFTYPTNTPTTSSANIHAFIHFPYHISNNGCGAAGYHPAKAEKDRYTHYLLKTTILINILYIFLIQLSHCIYLI